MTPLAMTAPNLNSPPPAIGVGTVPDAQLVSAVGDEFARHIEPDVAQPNPDKSSIFQSYTENLLASGSEPITPLQTSVSMLSPIAIDESLRLRADNMLAPEPAPADQSAPDQSGNPLPVSGESLPLTVADPPQPQAQAAIQVSSTSPIEAQLTEPYPTATKAQQSDKTLTDSWELITTPRDQFIDPAAAEPLREARELRALRELIEEPKPHQTRVPNDADLDVVSKSNQPKPIQAEPADLGPPREPLARELLDDTRMTTSNQGDHAEPGFQQRSDSGRPSTVAGSSALPQMGSDALAQHMDTLIETLMQAREHSKLSRGEMVLRHAEFGAVTMGLEHGEGDLRATLSSRDPAFASAAQAALAERVITPASGSDGTQSRGSDQPAQQSFTSSGNSHGFTNHNGEPHPQDTRTHAYAETLMPAVDDQQDDGSAHDAVTIIRSPSGILA